MQKHTYLNRNFFDTQRKKYRAVEEIAIEKQAVFYNTHPAIIEQEVFDKDRR
mgnify:CR=1 FL=1